MSVYIQPASWAPSAGYREFMAEFLNDLQPLIPAGLDVARYVTGFNQVRGEFLLEGPGWKRMAAPSALGFLAGWVDPSLHLNMILCLADAPCFD